MDIKEEFLKYCNENIDVTDVDLYEVLAEMDVERRPLYQASEDLHSQIEDLAEIFCDENGIESENFIDEYFGSTDDVFFSLDIF